MRTANGFQRSSVADVADRIAIMRQSRTVHLEPEAARICAMTLQLCAARHPDLRKSILPLKDRTISPRHAGIVRPQRSRAMRASCGGKWQNVRRGRGVSGGKPFDKSPD
jgi:hypothetical protein